MMTKPKADIFPWPRHSGPDFCVALVNSALPVPSARRIAPPLEGYADIVDLGEQAGVLDTAAARALRRMAAEQPELAAALFVRTLEVRTFLVGLTTALAAGRRLSGDDADALDAYLTEVPARLRLVPEGRHVRWQLEPDSHLDRIVWLIATSAAELVVADGHRRVRQCAGSDCRRLFYDRSNNQTRRWCDLRCGGLGKSRRYNRYRADLKEEQARRWALL